MSAVRPSIKTESKELKEAPSRLLQMEVHREVNRIPFAELTFRDGDPAQQKFAYSDQADMAPGKEMEVRLAYVGGDAAQERPPEFKGIIVRHSVEADAGGSRLLIEVRAQAYRMTQQRKSRVFRNMTNSDIFKQIIEEYGLKTGKIPATQPKHVEMVQYNCTDWDFLLSRADSCGRWVLVRFDEEGRETVDVIAPQLEGEPVHTFAFGKRPPLIYSLEMQADLDQVQGAVQSIAWDSKQQKMTRLVKANDFALAQGNFDPAELSGTLGKSSVVMKNPAEIEESELQAWADAQLIKSRLATIRGRMTVKGEANFQVNDLIAIDGISGPFNGNTLITGVRHVSGRQSWKTDIQFGLPGAWFTQKEDIAGLPAAGMLPPISGLRTGVVQVYEKDQAHRLLVKVAVPDIDETQGVVWARLAMPYAGNSHGLFFRPEPGDEVILGFIDNNPREVIILGSVFSEKNFPPVKDDKIDTENQVKRWVSGKGIQITWDESVPAFQIATAEKGKEQPSLNGKDPAKNTTQLFLGKDEAVLSDINGNVIRMDSKGITIESKKAIKIKGPTVDVN